MNLAIAPSRYALHKSGCSGRCRAAASSSAARASAAGRQAGFDDVGPAGRVEAQHRRQVRVVGVAGAGDGRDDALRRDPGRRVVLAPGVDMTVVADGWIRAGAAGRIRAGAGRVGAVSGGRRSAAEFACALACAFRHACHRIKRCRACRLRARDAGGHSVAAGAGGASDCAVARMITGSVCARQGRARWISCDASDPGESSAAGNPFRNGIISNWNQSKFQNRKIESPKCLGAR